MLAPPRSEPDAKRHRRPWQFGLRSLLALTAGVAVLSSVFFAMPKTVACLILLCVSFAQAPLLAVMIFYGNKYLRAFCIGAMFPAQVLFLIDTYIVTGLFWGTDGWKDLSVWIDAAEEYGEPYVIWVAATWGVSIVFGLLGMAAVWLVGSGGKQRETKPGEVAASAEMASSSPPHFPVGERITVD